MTLRVLVNKVIGNLCKEMLQCGFQRDATCVGLPRRDWEFDTHCRFEVSVFVRKWKISCLVACLGPEVSNEK